MQRHPPENKEDLPGDGGQVDVLLQVKRIRDETTSI